MRTCPFCTAEISSDLFACRRHWAVLSRDEQDEIHRAFHMYRSRLIGADKLRERQQKVIDAVKLRRKAWEEATGIGNQTAPKPEAQARCRTCKAPILWATTEQGKTIPMDAEPTADGNMYRDGDIVKAVSIFNQPEPGTPLFKSHFSHRKAVRK